MYSGSLKTFFPDRANPIEELVTAAVQQRPATKKAPMAPYLFGNAGREHMEKYGTRPEHFAKIGEKNHRHSVNNPYSQFRDKYSLEQVMKSRTVYEPLTMLQCCPTSDGAAAAIIVSEDFVRAHSLENQAVEITGITLKTDYANTFGTSSIDLIGGTMAKVAA